MAWIEHDWSGTPWRHVTLHQLINSGLVRVPLDIEHRYRGAQFAARIEDSSRIVFQGSAYDSLSTAGGVARKSIAGSFPGRDIPQTNGWTFWQFRSPDGTLRVLDDLRRELHERKAVSLVDGRRAEAQIGRSSGGRGTARCADRDEGPMARERQGPF